MRSSQGSILGPLLFILYINDLQLVTDLDLIMFADDTNIFATGLSPNALVNNLNNELYQVSEWFSANLLSLNQNKTCYMIFDSKIMSPDFDIKINNIIIKRAYVTKFLDIIITPDLKWDRHIETVIIKMSKVLGILRKIRYKLSQAILKQLYHSLMKHYIT